MKHKKLKLLQNSIRLLSDQKNIAQKISIEIFPNGLEDSMTFQLQIDLTGHFRLVDGSENL